MLFLVFLGIFLCIIDVMRCVMCGDKLVVNFLIVFIVIMSLPSEIVALDF